jgi:hypothetical protein
MSPPEAKKTPSKWRLEFSRFRSGFFAATVEYTHSSNQT